MREMDHFDRGSEILVVGNVRVHGFYFEGMSMIQLSSLGIMVLDHYRQNKPEIFARLERDDMVEEFRGL